LYNCQFSHTSSWVVASHNTIYPKNTNNSISFSLYCPQTTVTQNDFSTLHVHQLFHASTHCLHIYLHELLIHDLWSTNHILYPPYAFTCCIKSSSSHCSTHCLYIWCCSLHPVITSHLFQ
jgi:hypothetical protein